MTEERKQELAELLDEATKKENLKIRYGYGEASLPVNIYREYLLERWSSYGIDPLLSSLSIHLTPDIVDETIKSKLLDFIREELTQLIDKSVIPDFVRNSIQIVRAC